MSEFSNSETQIGAIAIPAPVRLIPEYAR